jgi:hypothetical protein
MLTTLAVCPDNGYIVKLSNIGIGPALIKSFEIYADDKKIDGTGFEPITKAVHIMFPQDSPEILNWGYLSPGGAMAASSSIDIVNLLFSPTSLPSAALLEHFQKRIKLVIKYTSIYEEEVFIYDSYKSHITP